MFETQSNLPFVNNISKIDWAFRCCHSTSLCNVLTTLSIVCRQISPKQILRDRHEMRLQGRQMSFLYKIICYIDCNCVAEFTVWAYLGKNIQIWECRVETREAILICFMLYSWDESRQRRSKVGMSPIRSENVSVERQKLPPVIITGRTCPSFIAKMACRVSCFSSFLKAIRAMKLSPSSIWSLYIPKASSGRETLSFFMLIPRT